EEGGAGGGVAAPPPACLPPVRGGGEVGGRKDAGGGGGAGASFREPLVRGGAPPRRSPLLSLGVSPRGSLGLLRAARARALTDGRDYLVPDDIKELAVAALAHRVMIKTRLGAAGAGGMDGEAAIRAIVQDVPVPR